MKNPYRIGRSVYLRPVERDDAARFVEWFNDRDITRYLLKWRPINFEQECELIAKGQGDPAHLILAAATIASDELVGVSGLHQIDPVNRNATFGITIGAKSEWGKGYGTEVTRLMVDLAFDTLNLHRVALEVFAEHASAQRVYEKLGFRREGVLRQRIWRDGKWHDLTLMSVLRDEWVRA
jgi:RimJ/RimL family protein N-acetyltransferase